MEEAPLRPLAELAITETSAESGYIYRFDREEGRAGLIASLGRAPVELAPVNRTAVAVHWDRQSAIVIHEGAVADWRFAPLPEFGRGRFEGVISIPLIDRAAVVGMANFCRKESATWKPRDLSFLLSLSLPLGAVVAAAWWRAEVERLSQRLADRKLIERAKGLLQARQGWSEEEAYLQIRRSSRQQRTPMRDIAHHIVETGGAGFGEEQ